MDYKDCDKWIIDNVNIMTMIEDNNGCGFILNYRIIERTK